MAIQVSNYTVVDNNRNLTNIVGADATTIAALNAAGAGGGGTVTLTASAAITKGQPVGIDSNGQVKPLASLTYDDYATMSSRYQGITTSSSAYLGGNYGGSKCCAVYNDDASKVMVCLAGAANGARYMHHIAGSRQSNGTMSFGTMTSQYYLGSNVPCEMWLTYAGSDKWVVQWSYGTSWPGTTQAAVLSVSGNTVTAGSATTVTNQRYDWVRSKSLDSWGDGTVLFCYSKYNGGSYQTAWRAASVSGTSLSLGTEYTTGGQANYPKCRVNQNSGRFAVAFRNSSNQGCMVIGTKSGTNLSYTINTSSAYSGEYGVEWVNDDYLIEDSGNKIWYRSSGNTASKTGGSLSAVNYTTSTSRYTYNWRGDPSTGRLFHIDANDPELHVAEPAMATSGNVAWNDSSPIIFGAEEQFSGHITDTMDYSGGKAVISGVYTNSNYAWPGYLSAEVDGFVNNSYVGIANENISSGSSGDIALTGSTVTGLSGFVAGKPYTVRLSTGDIITSSSITEALFIGLSSSSIIIR